MIYLAFFVIAILSAVLIAFYCNYEGVITTPFEFLPKKNIENEKIKAFSKKGSLVILSVVATVLALAQISLKANVETIGFVKLFVLFLIVICAGIIDFKRKIIPNLLVMFGLLFWVFISVFEFSQNENFKSVIISELIGFVIGFVFLALISAISKGALGMGDAKLFGIIGLISGTFCTYSTLLVSLIVSVIISVIGLIRKKLGRKDAIPFGPCITIGYTIVLFLASY